MSSNASRAINRGPRPLRNSEYVDQVVAAEDVVLFVKDWCPYCQRTMQLFNQLEVDALVVDLEKRPDGREIQSALLKKTGQTSVPNVFVKGVHLGGNDSTYLAHSSGRLQKLLDGEREG
ncbi:unnamed protein product [Chrysoparadoxa australica]